MFLLYMNPILIAAAVVPAVFLLIRVYRADRLEPEPSGLLLSLILRGVFATVIAMVLEELGSALLGSVYAENSLPYNIIMYFVIVAFSEEGAKYILLRRRTWRSDAFNCQFDGVVRNVADFGAFVDIGVHQDGLVHISKLAKGFVKRASDVVAVGDVIPVRVIEVDVARKRISLERVDGLLKQPKQPK